MSCVLSLRGLHQHSSDVAQCASITRGSADMQVQIGQAWDGPESAFLMAGGQPVLLWSHTWSNEALPNPALANSINAI